MMSKEKESPQEIFEQSSEERWRIKEENCVKEDLRDGIWKMEIERNAK